MRLWGSRTFAPLRECPIYRLNEARRELSKKAQEVAAIRAQIVDLEGALAQLIDAFRSVVRVLWHFQIAAVNIKLLYDWYIDILYLYSSNRLKIYINNISFGVVTHRCNIYPLPSIIESTQRASSDKFTSCERSSLQSVRRATRHRWNETPYRRRSNRSSPPPPNTCEKVWIG